jgi:hypothetical protein
VNTEQGLLELISSGSRQPWRFLVHGNAFSVWILELLDAEDCGGFQGENGLAPKQPTMYQDRHVAPQNESTQSVTAAVTSQIPTKLVSRCRVTRKSTGAFPCNGDADGNLKGGGGGWWCVQGVALHWQIGSWTCP